MTLTVVRLHQALVTLMLAFLAHCLPFTAVAAQKTTLVGREALQEHERMVHEQAPQKLLRQVGRRKGMGGRGSGFWSGVAPKNVRTHFPKCFPIILSKQFVTIAPCSFVLEFCTRTL
jgi:hypothetical protein